MTTKVPNSMLVSPGGGGDILSVKNAIYNVVGNNNPADAAGISQAMDDAIAQNKTLYFPAGGVYNLGTSFPAKSGRLFMLGEGNATVIGNLEYFEPSFPVSADTVTPLTETAKFFSATGINFRSPNSGYALTLRTVQQTSFLRTFQLIGCNFYGLNGLLAQHMIGFNLTSCSFYNESVGMRAEGCVNGEFTASRFENIRGIGIFITKHTTEQVRKGGENLRFTGCEFDVCTTGIVAEEHLWLSINNCLLDYCDVPLRLIGSNFAKASQTYFGASNVATNRFSALPGYIGPPALGVAVYGRAGGVPVGDSVIGFSADQCEFISYIGGTAPIISLDGFVNGSFPRSLNTVSIQNSLIYANVAHARPNLCEISAGEVARVSNTTFRSVNLSSVMVNAYRTNDILDYRNDNNSFYLCLQSSVQVGSIHESFKIAFASRTTVQTVPNAPSHVAVNFITSQDANFGFWNASKNIFTFTKAAKVNVTARGYVKNSATSNGTQAAMLTLANLRISGSVLLGQGGTFNFATSNGLVQEKTIHFQLTETNTYAVGTTVELVALANTNGTSAITEIGAAGLETKISICEIL